MDEKLEDVNLDDIDEDAIENSRFTIDPTDPKQIELVDSIRSHGSLIEPIVLAIRTEVDGAGGSRRYALIAGRRRLQAHRTLGKKTVRAVIKPAMSRATALATNLAENVQRQDLRPCEVAAALLRLRESRLREGVVRPTRRSGRGGRVPPNGIADAELAERVGLSQPWVNTLLRIETKLCPELRPVWLSGRCSPTFLANLVAFPPDEQRARYDLYAGTSTAPQDDQDAAAIDRDIDKAFGPRKGTPAGRTLPIRRRAIEELAAEIPHLTTIAGFGTLTPRDKQLLGRLCDHVLSRGPRIFTVRPGPRTARSIVIEDDDDGSDLSEPSP